MLDTLLCFILGNQLDDLQVFWLTCFVFCFVFDLLYWNKISSSSTSHSLFTGWTLCTVIEVFDCDCCSRNAAYRLSTHLPNSWKYAVVMPVQVKDLRQIQTVFAVYVSNCRRFWNYVLLYRILPLKWAAHYWTTQCWGHYEFDPVRIPDVTKLLKPQRGFCKPKKVRWCYRYIAVRAVRCAPP